MQSSTFLNYAYFNSIKVRLKLKLAEEQTQRYYISIP